MAYFPNGAAGEKLDLQCLECLHADEDTACPVAWVQQEFNYEQVKDGNEDLRRALSCLVGDDGECKVREAINSSSGIINKNKPCLKRKLVFGDQQQIFALR